MESTASTLQGFTSAKQGCQMLHGPDSACVAFACAQCTRRSTRSLAWRCVQQQMHAEGLSHMQEGMPPTRACAQSWRTLQVAWNEVAVAELAWTSEKDRDRIFSEIRVLKQLKHKNIITLHDWWFDPKISSICFITELFTDGTLRQ